MLNQETTVYILQIIKNYMQYKPHSEGQDRLWQQLGAQHISDDHGNKQSKVGSRQTTQ